jgi:hypothetical protein
VIRWLQSLHDEAEGTNWPRDTFVEPARTPADDAFRRKAWAVILPMNFCVLIIVAAGLWDWLA